MESGTARWGASRRPDAAAPRSWAVAEGTPSWGRPRLRLIRGDGLEAPWTGAPAHCAACGLRSRKLRVIRYASRPWCDGYRRLRPYSLVHYSCAVVPDEPLEPEVPRSWLVRPLPPAPLSLLDVGAPPPERV